MAFSTPDTQIAGYVVLASDWNELVNNFLAVNGFFSAQLWPIADAHAPLSGVTAAGSSTIESSGAGTFKPVLPLLSPDATADEGREWVRRVPRGFGVSAVLTGLYYMSSANTDKDAILVAQVAAMSDGDASATAKVYDSANSLTERVPDSAGEVDAFSITLTNDDGMAAGDWLNIGLFRDADNGSDNAAGDFNILVLTIEFDLAT